jgi:hypothetical protein
MPFNEPETSGRLNPRDCIGHLLMVWPIEYIEDSPTRYSKPGQASDVIVVDVVDLDDFDEGTGLAGKLYRNVWWRPGNLIKALKRTVGAKDPYLAWMRQGGASPGMNAPFKLESATADPKSVEKAETWLAAYPKFLPSDPVIPGEREVEPLDQLRPSAATTEPLPPPRAETALERLARISQQGAARLQSPPEQIPF